MIEILLNSFLSFLMVEGVFCFFCMMIYNLFEVFKCLVFFLKIVWIIFFLVWIGGFVRIEVNV